MITLILTRGALSKILARLSSQIFRAMYDDEKLYHLSELMNKEGEESAKEEFGILLKTLPVDLVDIH